MANRTPKIDTTMEMLPGLFDSATAEGALDIDLGLRQCFSRAMHASGKDRYQIAAEMSRLMRGSITKEMLDKYAASDQANGMKANALAAFCFVCNTFEPLQYVLKPLGSDVLRPEDSSVLEWARLKRESKTIEQRIKQLEAAF
jgi:hypothetical protein